jgi:hypothetical protein
MTARDSMCNEEYFCNKRKKGKQFLWLLLCCLRNTVAPIIMNQNHVPEKSMRTTKNGIDPLSLRESKNARKEWQWIGSELPIEAAKSLLLMALTVSK